MRMSINHPLSASPGYIFMINDVMSRKEIPLSTLFMLQTSSNENLITDSKAEVSEDPGGPAWRQIGYLVQHIPT